MPGAAGIRRVLVVVSALMVSAVVLVEPAGAAPGSPRPVGAMQVRLPSSAEPAVHGTAGSAGFRAGGSAVCGVRAARLVARHRRSRQAANRQGVSGLPGFGSAKPAA
jgi:cysteine sulfinate desulfinase/cysteine desulfurase-like protein